MRAILLVGVLGLLAAEAGAGAPKAADELRFGIEVAKKGLWQEARFRFERALVLDPQSANAYNNLGVALEQQGEFAQARQAYEKALELAPGSLYVQQNYDLFREADDKRNRKAKKRAAPSPTPAPSPSPSPQP
jgi:Flp pilus assembly protein TadD